MIFPVHNACIACFRTRSSNRAGTLLVLRDVEQWTLGSSTAPRVSGLSSSPTSVSTSTKMEGAFDINKDPRDVALWMGNNGISAEVCDVFEGKIVNNVYK